MFPDRTCRRFHVGMFGGDLSPRVAEFNICLTSAHASAAVVRTPYRV
jgi:hypothetical protein